MSKCDLLQEVVVVGIVCVSVAAAIFVAGFAGGDWGREGTIECPPPDAGEYLQVRRVDDKLRGTYFAVVEYGRAQKINRIEDCGK